jgi:cyclic pyranopterin phosphate synthase
MSELTDGYFRTIDYLRISITGRCNLRCLSCMSSDGVCPAIQRDIRYEKITYVVKAAARLPKNRWLRLVDDQVYAS